MKLPVGNVWDLFMQYVLKNTKLINYLLYSESCDLNVPAGNYGSCINQNKYSSVQDDEYNYHVALQAYLIRSLLRVKSWFLWALRLYNEASQHWT